MARAPFKNFELFMSDFLAELETQLGSMSFKIGTSAHESVTDGWWCDVLTLGAHRPYLVVLYDRFLPLPRPSLWIGLYSRSAKKVREHFKELSVDIDQRRVFGDKDITSKNGHDAIAGAVSMTKLERLSSESYWGTGYFAGRYFIGDLGDAKTRLTISKKALLFTDMLLTNYKNAGDDSETYRNLSGLEGRRVVVKHLRRERYGALPVEAKKRDGFRCRVCSSRLLDRYSPFGRTVAEAHHILPLGSSDGERRTTLDDLITVCPNCHRVLHTMEGAAGDWKKLAAIYRRNSSKTDSSA